MSRFTRKTYLQAGLHLLLALTSGNRLWCHLLGYNELSFDSTSFINWLYWILLFYIIFIDFSFVCVVVDLFFIFLFFYINFTKFRYIDCVPWLHDNIVRIQLFPYTLKNVTVGIKKDSNHSESTLVKSSRKKDKKNMKSCPQSKFLLSGLCDVSLFGEHPWIYNKTRRKKKNHVESLSLPMSYIYAVTFAFLASMTAAWNISDDIGMLYRKYVHTGRGKLRWNTSFAYRKKLQLEFNETAFWKGTYEFLMLFSTLMIDFV